MRTAQAFCISNKLMSDRLRPVLLNGSALTPYLDALGVLRIAVFREYPYLYEGSLDYERRYLQTYTQCSDSLVVLLWDNDTLVGATTCLPLSAEDADFHTPFIQAGYDVNSVMYFGESILLPAYRGAGYGKAFFQYRENHARHWGATHSTFCRVNRPHNDPRRPPNYQPLDAFWRTQGYTEHPQMFTQLRWQEIGESHASDKTLTFWVKPL